MFSMILSLLPTCVVMLLGIGGSLLATGSSNEWIISLGLSTEQVEQLKAIENSYADSINQLERDVQSNERSLTQLIINAGSIEDLRQKEREIEAIKIAAAQVYFEKFLEIREVLTPEQLLKQCEPFTLTAEQQLQKFMDQDQ